MKLIDLDPTLASKPDFGSGVSDRVISLRERPLDSLTLGEVAFCLRQSVALPYVVPIALKALAEQPLIEVDGFPGDLLVSILHAAKTAKLSEPQFSELYGICASATAGAESIAEHVVPTAQAFMDHGYGA
jgi:hypothetical protein